MEHAKAAVVMAEPLDLRQIFFTNLRLMGFDPLALEKKFAIPINKNMFSVPNKKAFEVVIHFMFERLNPIRCAEEFRYCWPIYDKKAEQQFRKVCHNWLSEIAKEDPDAHLPRIVASLFISPGGDKLYQLLFHFSNYVLLKSIKNENGMKSRDFLARPLLTRQCKVMGAAMGKAVQCSSVRHRQRFLDFSQQAVHIQNEWKQYATELIKTHRAVSKAVREVERDLKAEVQKAAQHSTVRGSPIASRGQMMFSHDYDIQTVKRAQKVQRVRELWKSIDELHETQAPERAVVESILQRTLDKYKIDAADINMRVPDLLLKECEKEIQRRNIDNTYKGGKLNLLSLVHLWNLSLHLYIEHLHQVGVPNFEDCAAAVTTQVHTHHAYVANATALRSRLEGEMLPELKKSIAQLKVKLNKQEIHRQSPQKIRTSALGLGLLPYTPPANFEASGKGTPDAVEAGLLARTPAEEVPTPEAALQLIDAVNVTARGSLQTSLVQGSPVYAPKRTLLGQPSGFNMLPDSKIPGPQIQKSHKKHRKQLQTSKDPAHSKSPAGKTTPTRQAKATSSGTTMMEMSPEEHWQAKERLTAQTEKVFKAPQATAKKAKRTQHKSITPKVTRHENLTASFTQSVTPQAHKILASQIVSSMMETSPEGNRTWTAGQKYTDVKLEDPLAALDKDAFRSRDKLHRTPLSTVRQANQDIPRPAWGNEEPLSVAHFDDSRGSSDGKDSNKDPLATKLFSPHDSDEENIITVGENGKESEMLPENKVNQPYQARQITGHSPHDSYQSNRDEEQDNLQFLQDLATMREPKEPEQKSDNSNGRPTLGPHGLGAEDTALEHIMSTAEADLVQFNNLSDSYQGEGNENEDQQEEEMKSLVSTPEAYRTMLKGETPQVNIRTKKAVKESEKNKRSPNQKESERPEPCGGVETEELITAMTMPPTPFKDMEFDFLTSGRTPSGQEETVDEEEEHNLDLDAQDARIIQLQNGLFQEDLDKSIQSPLRDIRTNHLRSRKHFVTDPDLKTTLDFQSHQDGGIEEATTVGQSRESSIVDSILSRKSPRMDPHNSQHTSYDSESLKMTSGRESDPFNSSSIEDIIARYKRLRTGSDTNSEQPLLSSAATSGASSLEVESVDTSRHNNDEIGALDEKFVCRSPNGPPHVRQAKPFCLDLGLDETPSSGSTSGLTSYTATVSLDDMAPTYLEKVVPGSPPVTPVTTPRGKKKGSLPGTPIVGLSSIPMSPATAALHDQHTRDHSSVRTRLDDIMGEDDSVLVPSSPPNGTTEYDVMVGTLVDI